MAETDEDYTFDASLTVSAEDFPDKKAAADHILETLSGGDIAAYLCEEGTMSTIKAIVDSGALDG